MTGGTFGDNMARGAALALGGLLATALAGVAARRLGLPLFPDRGAPPAPEIDPESAAVSGPAVPMDGYAAMLAQPTSGGSWCA